MEANTFNLLFGLDTLWVLVSGIFVFFMQIGFALLEAGFARSKNTINILLKNTLDFCMSILCFYIIGFGLMHGGSDLFAGSKYFLLQGLPLELDGISASAFFFFQAMIAATVATIVSGATTERLKLVVYLSITIIVTTFIYPIVGHWVWGNGWLSTIGFFDFAGAGAVHLLGGTIALTCAILAGSRRGRFDQKRTQEFTPKNISLIVLGGFILWFGFFGFNGGAIFGITGSNAQLASYTILNTLFAGIAGSLSMYVYFMIRQQTVNITTIINGMLAGLVAITAIANSTSIQYAIIIGILGSVAMKYAESIVLRKKIDDTVSAFAVHGVGGFIGILCVGIFHNELGFLVTGSPKQLLIQLLGACAISIWSASIMYGVLRILRVIHGGLRVHHEHENKGMDKVHHDASAYIEVDIIKNFWKDVNNKETRVEILEHLEIHER